MLLQLRLQPLEQREGVVVNTVYNGCGILTAQMRTILDQQQGSGFPDTYMACDRYYLESVKDWFQDDVDISDTSVVIAVPKGNIQLVHWKTVNLKGKRIEIRPETGATVDLDCLQFIPRQSTPSGSR